MLGQRDMNNLLNQRKLVLLVDLDQTLIHTTNDNIPPNLKVLLTYSMMVQVSSTSCTECSDLTLYLQDVWHFQLHPSGPWYHTRLRPHARPFLEKISKYYELHICTFGVREYAHWIAHFLDPDRKLFGQRILSRNECVDPMSKKANMRSVCQAALYNWLIRLFVN